MNVKTRHYESDAENNKKEYVFYSFYEVGSNGWKAFREYEPLKVCKAQNELLIIVKEY